MTLCPDRFHLTFANEDERKVFASIRICAHVIHVMRNSSGMAVRYLTRTTLHQGLPTGALSIRETIQLVGVIEETEYKDEGSKIDDVL